MRIRKPHTELDERSERALEEEIRAAAGPDLHGPQDPFWQNLLVRTNARIDDVASGKGITISWAARVAIPGVVAILAFLVGLHYYIPELTAKRDQLTDILNVLPDAAQDSLLERYSIGPETLSPAIAEDVFNVPVVQAQDYYLENSDLSQLSELLSDEEVSTVLTMLESSTIATPEPTEGGGS
jgi:hypothetical protein